MIILFLFPLAFSLLIIVVRMQEDKRMSDEQIEEEKKKSKYNANPSWIVPFEILCLFIVIILIILY